MDTPATTAAGEAPRPLMAPGLVSRIFFAWIGPLLRVGASRPLEQHDIDSVQRQLPHWSFIACQPAAADFAKERAARSGSGNALLWAMYRSLRRPFWLGALLISCQQVVLFLMPLTLARMLAFLDTPGAAAADGWWLTGELFLLGCCKTLLDNHYYITMQRCGIRCMAIATDAVFRKALRLSPAARAAIKSGKIVNLMQMDARRFYDTSWFWHLQWAAVVQVLSSLGLLFWLLGPPMLAGLGAMLLMLPLNALMAQRQSALSKACSVATDRRMDLVNAAVTGIRAIKTSGWERSFLRRLQAARATELRLVRQLQVVRAYANVIGQVTPSVVALAAILCYALWAGERLVPHKVFTALSLFEAIKEPLARIPKFVAAMVDLRISARRIEGFLLAEEVEPLPALVAAGAAGGGGGGGGDKGGDKGGEAPPLLEVRGGAFAWERAAGGSLPSSSSSAAGPLRKAARGTPAPATAGDAEDAEQGAAAAAPRFELRGVDIRVRRGGLVVVCGGIGSGKTSLLHALLSELHTVGGGGEVLVRPAAAAVATGAAGARSDARRCCPGAALVCQQPWIVNATVRQNILLGGGGGLGASRGDGEAACDARAYATAIARAQLGDDLAALPAGDATEIGERGINLSGGQKQRVALARVVYSGARLAVLDDPLSALDATIGSAVFDSIISDPGCCEYGGGGGGGEMARVVAASAPPQRLLRAADCIIVLREGAVAASGSFDELSASGALRGLACDEGGDDAAAPSSAPSSARRAGGDAKPAAGSSSSSVGGGVGSAGGAGSGSAAAAPAAAAAAASVAHGVGAPGSLATAEDRETGVVKLAVLKQFVDAAGRGGIALMLAGYLLGAAAFLGQSVWLAVWSEQQARGGAAAGDNVPYALGYAGFALLVLLFSLLRYLLAARLALRASALLHARMASAVLRAPLAWFDTTPSGRVLNRFGRDCHALDLDVWMALTYFLDLAFPSAITIVLVAYIAPYFALFVPPVFLFFGSVQRYYRASSRELKRLLAVSRSPLYNFFSGVLPLNGLATIRAFRLQKVFAAENARLVDANNACQYVSKVTDRWLGTRFELTGNVLLLGACVATMHAKGEGASPAFLSLCLTMTMTMARAINYTLRTFTQAESEMTSVERVLHFANELPSERYSWAAAAAEQEWAAAVAEEKRQREHGGGAAPAAPPSDNPVSLGGLNGRLGAVLGEEEEEEAGAERSGGGGGGHGAALTFEGVSMRYRPGLPLVLDGVSLAVAAGSRVGVVGRTGAGKSSLLHALLRLVELEGVGGSGRVLLGGVDVAALPVDELRRRVAVCPQDCVVFAGSLRSNIDPFGAHSDDAVLEALRSVGLRGEQLAAAVVPREGAGAAGAGVGAAAEPGASADARALLDRSVAESGGDLSGGERQLLCLARVLLRCRSGGASLVVLDEATSVMGHRSDLAIQEAVRTQLTGLTILVIAHRLRSVIDADAVCVMADGRCAEYGAPHALLQRSDGRFAQLVAQSGEELELRKLAAAARSAKAAQV